MKTLECLKMFINQGYESIDSVKEPSKKIISGKYIFKISYENLLIRVSAFFKANVLLRLI